MRADGVENRLVAGRRREKEQVGEILQCSMPKVSRQSKHPRLFLTLSRAPLRRCGPIAGLLVQDWIVGSHLEPRAMVTLLKSSGSCTLLR